MKNLFTLLFLTIALSLNAQFYLDLSPQECFDLIEANEDNDKFTILDVRTKTEYDPEHIADAYNRDFYATDFREQLDSLDKSRVYLIYCRSGNRSGQTLDMVQELEFDTVYNMLGGITRWNQDGYPVTDVIPDYDPNLYAGTSSVSGIEFNSVELFPNPTSGLLFINTAQIQFDKVEIHDNMGQLVFRSEQDAVPKLVNLQEEASGIYIVTFYVENKIIGNKKIVKY